MPFKFLLIGLIASTAINMEDYFRCQNETICDSKEAMLIILYRLKYARNFTDMEEDIGIEFRNVEYLAIFVDSNYVLLFDNLILLVRRLKSYSLAIRSKVISQHGHLVGPAIDTALLLDGKCLEISRPMGV